MSITNPVQIIFLSERVRKGKYIDFLKTDENEYDENYLFEWIRMRI